MWNVGKLSAIGQLTRPTQPFIPLGSTDEYSKVQLHVSYFSYGWRQLVNAYDVKAGIVYLSRLLQ